MRYDQQQSAVSSQQVKGGAQAAGTGYLLYTLHWVDWFGEHELVPVPSISTAGLLHA